MQDQQKQTADQNQADNWYFAFYYAPNDPRVSVPKRWGWGWTLNFARAESYLIVGAPILMGAAIVACVLLTR